MNVVVMLYFNCFPLLYHTMLVSVYRDNLISISDLINSIQKLQKISDGTKFEKIAKVLDADKDGVIDYSNAMEVSGPLLPHESCTT